MPCRPPRHILAAVAAAALLLSVTRADADPALRDALTEVGARDWSAAARAAGRVASEAAIARDIVEWHRLRAAEGTLADYAGFLDRRPDWPGLPLLRARGERAIGPATDPADVRAYFAGHPPQTADGALALIAALEAQGDAAAATDAAVRLWREGDLDPAQEARLRTRYSDALADHHAERLDRLLWAGEHDAAERLLPLVSDGWQRLARARIALRSEQPGVDALIDAIPEALADDPGLAWERFRWRMAKGFTDSAEDLMLARSRSAASLGHPARWAGLRAARARDRLRDGATTRAYRIAAGHGLTEGGGFADLEWLAGFIALRHLDDPETALGHFRTLRAGVTTPISLSRAGYWEGRALEALGATEDARAAFGRAAEHQSAYYGQLAAERIGLPLPRDLTGAPRPRADWRRAPLAESSVLRAARMLHAADDRRLAWRFALHLGESQDAAGYVALASFAQSLGDAKLRLEIAKQAAARGIILGDAYFPESDLVPRGLAVDRALALAIARRESEFDPEARSPAGARGLMQLMPGTAELMSDEMGEDYDLGRLTADPAYNARLGAGYLARLIAEFGDAPVLVAAGYNAGPGRPREWIARFGDPRDPAVDPVDWVEHVPFAETRNYIMRVLEALVIYRAKLDGAAPAPSAFLRGG